jgi:hypothetical protein
MSNNVSDETRGVVLLTSTRCAGRRYGCVTALYNPVLKFWTVTTTRRAVVVAIHNFSRASINVT